MRHIFTSTIFYPLSNPVYCVYTSFDAVNTRIPRNFSNALYSYCYVVAIQFFRGPFIAVVIFSTATKQTHRLGPMSADSQDHFFISQLLLFFFYFFLFLYNNFSSKNKTVTVQYKYYCNSWIFIGINVLFIHSFIHSFYHLFRQK
jgi:hypothetical protein